jgi:5-methylcytosine-specific restriction endonuclease McrA
MPIRPENRALYPADWPAISLAIRERAGQRCEDCGVPNHALGGRDGGKFYPAASQGECSLGLDWPKPGDYAWCRGLQTARLRIIRIVLTVAHLNHDPTDNRPENLRALCQRCHNRLDAAHRAAGRKARARRDMAAGDLLQEGSP